MNVDIYVYSNFDIRLPCIFKLSALRLPRVCVLTASKMSSTFRVLLADFCFSINVWLITLAGASERGSSSGSPHSNLK